MYRYLVLVSALFVSQWSWAASQVQFSPVSLAQHLLRVEMTLDELEPGTHRFSIPVWRTGRYQQLDFANALSGLAITDLSGNSISFESVNDHTWHFRLTEPTRVSIQYLLSANELGLRTRHLDQSHLFIDFASAVMVLKQHEKQPYLVEFKGFPEEWRLRSSLAQGSKKNQLIAPDYQHLIDSPAEMGLHEWVSFDYQGTDFELVVWGDTPADLAQVATDTKAIVKAAYELWGSFPFKRYVFMLHVTDGVRGGTEHLNSTIMQWDRFKLIAPEDYLNYMGLVAHEFVHSWNVKAYRPAAYVPYDLTQRAISPLLWLAEGSTSYLQEKLLLNSGLMDEKTFLKRLSKRWVRYTEKPGGQVQSVAQASQSKWVQGWNNHQHNFFANIYDEGFLATWLQDLWLLENSQGNKGIAALHRYLYQHYSLPNGLTEEQVILAMGRLTGTGLEAKQWWQQFVQQPLPIMLDSVTSRLGLTVTETGEELGWQANWKAEQDGLVITAVNRQGAAWQAGLAEGDRVVAVNGFAVSSENIEHFRKSWKKGEAQQLHLFRQGKLQVLTIKVIAKAEKVSLEKDKNASESVKALRSAWFKNK